MCLKVLKNKITDKQAKVGVISLGYVGLPLLVAFAKKGFAVIGFDIDQHKIDQIEKGQSYIRHICSEDLNHKLINATSDMSRLDEADVIIICVPTPLDTHREPDLTYVVQTAYAIARYLRRGPNFSR